ncbi:2-octaprenyl-6-methoxyphenyl hydroxylase [Salinicola sp. DM10]|uniref:2-octaprenyl-6-methoxyphenyl hydroxylase n=1 Tax=Salinicola sp. DM10 TaxID=2815721 RepID=UPI001A8EEEFA|nr:2-octaprenyl-6-methoxyphenyl hydroxylase [Salinicola sp. DM10]MCE3027863.1 2-octaprenyl-6-methoxyphenyl hydroxylase [Salinicola sp. DM10]
MSEATQPVQVDVAIIGGGLVGASLACALGELAREEGLRIAIVEAQPLPATDTAPLQPSFDVRASAIAYGSRRHFERLALWSDAEGEGMAAQASPIRHIHISERGQLGVTRLHAEDVGSEALGYVIPNAWMGRVLHRRLAELPLDWHCPARVEALDATPEGYRLTLDDGQRLDAGLTVLADGGRSGLKERLGIESAHHAYDQSALIATVETSRAHQGWAFERFSREGPIALLPLSGRRMTLVWTFEQGAEQAALALSDDAFLSRLQHAFGDRAGRFQRVGQRYAYPLSLVTARETIRPGLAVLGNAAHALHPVAGQGFNLALRGVMDLAAEIQRARAEGRSPGDASVLAAFEARRSADYRQIVRFSDGLIRLFGLNYPLMGQARGLGLSGLNALAPLKRMVARRAMGLER